MSHTVDTNNSGVARKQPGGNENALPRSSAEHPGEKMEDGRFEVITTCHLYKEEAQSHSVTQHRVHCKSLPACGAIHCV